MSGVSYEKEDADTRMVIRAGIVLALVTLVASVVVLFLFRWLGEREAGTARLEEAVAAFREALKERTQERVPLDWAMTQTDLGHALMRLGERDGGTARLEEAVAVFREALKERTQGRVPLDWAGTQINLGNALLTLGEREAGDRLPRPGVRTAMSSPTRQLIGGERHALVSRAAVGAVVLVPEGDAVLVEGDQPAVGDGDAVGVARQIGEHRLGSAERGL